MSNQKIRKEIIGSAFYGLNRDVTMLDGCVKIKVMGNEC